ncbi:hypothetical protein [Microvirga sp. M2]|uniref:hypothetical protein n=1 Tax=Microvirga sp. M2 TaxID=3073270 RepID=UPI0039C13ECE
MLNRPQPRTCIECGLPYGHGDFAYHAGKAENGPSYWSDRGLLCSVVCSTAHYERREKAGEAMKAPAPNPLER